MKKSFLTLTTLTLILGFALLNAYAQPSFSDAILIENTEVDGPFSVYAADLNGDGNIDILSASTEDKKLAWYENTGNNDHFLFQKIINMSDDTPQYVCTADIDNDNDEDIISVFNTGFRKSNVSWFENKDGKGTFGTANIIIALESNSIIIFPADLDGDTHTDLLFTDGDSKVAWSKNLDGNGTFGTEINITSSASGPLAVFASDLDNDNNKDILLASRNDNTIMWYKNIDGKGNFTNKTIISSDVNEPRLVYAVDIDKDGDMDVISGSTGDNTLAWYENTNGKGTFSSKNQIANLINDPWSLSASDIDADGDIDIILGANPYDRITWYENTDGKGTYSTDKIITTSVEGLWAIFNADLNGDGHIDILSASYSDDKIAWYKNEDGLGNFSDQKVITTSTQELQTIFVSDLDGDNDMDILSASSSDDKIAWYENIDGYGSKFSSQNIISDSADGAYSVISTDIDGDNDMDVISASEFENKIAWYKNIDGKGNFSSENVISSTANTVRYLLAVDVDADLDMDLISASLRDDKITWYENLDGQGSFGSENVISAHADEVSSIAATDLDNDNDIDIISISKTPKRKEKVAWYKNIDGKGSFGSEIIIPTTETDIDNLNIADLDNDRDMDILIYSSSFDKIFWLENLDGVGTFDNDKIIATDVYGNINIITADIDNDGDMDVISNNKIVWYENVNNAATFNSHEYITNNDYFCSYIIASDIDNDNDMDIIVASIDDEIICYKNEMHTGMSIISGYNQNIILSPNYPNPFNPITHISFTLPHQMFVSLNIYNLSGQKVMQLVNEIKSEGQYKYTFDGSNLTSGIYIYSLKYDKNEITKKMLLLK